jgi:hypothetical protein
VFDSLSLIWYKREITCKYFEYLIIVSYIHMCVCHITVHMCVLGPFMVMFYLYGLAVPFIACAVLAWSGSMILVAMVLQEKFFPTNKAPVTPFKPEEEDQEVGIIPTPAAAASDNVDELGVIDQEADDCLELKNLPSAPTFDPSMSATAGVQL